MNCEDLILYQKNHEIEFECEQQKKNRENTEELQRKKAPAKKKPIREALSAEEFYQIVDHVKSVTYQGSRVRLALILLYATGLRISNLLVLKCSDCDQLISEGFAHVPLGVGSGHLIIAGSIGKSMLLKHGEDIKTLQKGKQAEDFLFTAKPLRGVARVISRELLNREVNQALKKASEELSLGKYLRSHSFRASFVADLLSENVSIHKVKDLVGHSDLKSTLLYQRSGLALEEACSIIGDVNRMRLEKSVEKREGGSGYNPPV